LRYASSRLGDHCIQSVCFLDEPLCSVPSKSYSTILIRAGYISSDLIASPYHISVQARKYICKRRWKIVIVCTHCYRLLEHLCCKISCPKSIFIKHLQLAISPYLHAANVK
ncbi:hypothetical protein Tcan_00813, partial [Toxocara canis]